VYTEQFVVGCVIVLTMMPIYDGADCLTGPLIGLNEPSVTSRQRPDERRYGDGNEVPAVDKLARSRAVHQVDYTLVESLWWTIVVNQHCNGCTRLTALQRAKLLHLKYTEKNTKIMTTESSQ